MDQQQKHARDQLNHSQSLTHLQLAAILDAAEAAITAIYDVSDSPLGRHQCQMKVLDSMRAMRCRLDRVGVLVNITESSLAIIDKGWRVDGSEG